MNKRKIDNENRGFQKRWETQYLFIMQMGKPLCLECFQVISVCKEYNLKRHYSSFHEQQYFGYQGDSRSALVESLKMKLSSQQAAFSTVTKYRENNVSVAASFAVSRIMAKENLSITDGKAIEQCAVELARTFGDEQMAQRFQSVSLSPETVSYCISEINNQIHERLYDSIYECSYFSVALIENSNTPNISEILIFIRLTDENFNVVEDLLTIHHTSGDSCGKINLEDLDAILKPYGGIEKCTAVVSDGINFGIDDYTEIIGKGSKCQMINCITNQQTICESTLALSGIMDTIVKIVDLIKNNKNAHLNNKFETFLAKLYAEYNYDRNDWLCDDKCLQNLFDLRKEIHFLLLESEIKSELTSSFIDVKSIYSFAFLTDMTKYLNTFKQSMQNKNHDITALYSQITGFRNKLPLLKSNLENNDLTHFPCCKEIFEEMKYLNDQMLFAMFVPNLDCLIDHFNDRFKHFDDVKSSVLLFNDPLNYDIQNATAKYQMELCELQADQLIESRTENGAEFYKLLPSKYAILRDFGLQMTSMFGNTFVAEKAIADVKRIKSKYGENINEGLLQRLLRIATTSFDADMKRLVATCNIPEPLQ